jgi:hypothetical protein
MKIPSSSPYLALYVTNSRDTLIMAHVGADVAEKVLATAVKVDQSYNSAVENGKSIDRLLSHALLTR